MERVKLIVRYRDGRMIKGFSHNFFPNKSHFHISPIENPCQKPLEVLMSQLKAVFVVRDFCGDSGYHERKEYAAGEKPSGRQVEVTFQDGEVMVGSTLGFKLDQPCFCIFPADPKSNNTRVFVILSSVKHLRYLETTPKVFADRPMLRSS